MNTIDSTKLIELAKANYKMLKEKGKEGEEVLHYNGFLDGFARGMYEGVRNPWHKASDELPKTDILAIRKNARSPKVLKYYPSADRWFYDEYGYTEEGVREYYDYFMEIPEIKED